MIPSVAHTACHLLAHGFSNWSLVDIFSQNYFTFILFPSSRIFKRNGKIKKNRVVTLSFTTTN